MTWAMPDDRWERISDRIEDWGPYVTLATSSVLTLAFLPQPLTDRVVTLALAAGAAAWTALAFTATPKPRQERQARMRIYFLGMLLLASLLMFRSPLFFVYAITGFLHAIVLRPSVLMLVGVAATSILINTITSGFPWPTPELWVLFITIIVIQTVAIGIGSLLGEKLAALSAQRKEAVARLEAALEENAGLHAQLVSQAREAGVLDERQRMAREIHDTLAQGLTGIITKIEAAEHAQDRPMEWRRHLADAAQLARASLAEARRSVQGSQPTQLDAASLPEALASVAEEWSGMSGVPVEVSTTGQAVDLHPEVEAALLRTAQEALANVAKHARASRAGVTLSYMGDVVTLDVRDDGVGFEASDPTRAASHGDERGFGLGVMRQRVARVAGSLNVESEPGGGTAVSVTVPALPAPASATP